MFSRDALATPRFQLVVVGWANNNGLIILFDLNQTHLSKHELTPTVTPLSHDIGHPPRVHVVDSPSILEELRFKPRINESARRQRPENSATKVVRGHGDRVGERCLRRIEDCASPA